MKKPLVFWGVFISVAAMLILLAWTSGGGWTVQGRQEMAESDSMTTQELAKLQSSDSQAQLESLGYLGGAPMPAAAAPAEVAASTAPRRRLASVAGEAAPTAPGQYLIRNASASLQTDDPSATAKALSREAETMGGYISGFNESTNGLGLAFVTMQLRLPNEKLDSALAGLDRLGKILNRDVSTQDVTMEFTDTESRLRNLRKTEERLIEHLERSGKLEDIIRAEGEITRVREQIEIFEGRLRALQGQIQYATLSLNIAQTPAAEPMVPPKTFSTAKVFSEAVRDLVEFGQVMWARAIWVGVWGVVWVPLAMIAGLIAIYIYRHTKARNASPA